MWLSAQGYEPSDRLAASVRAVCSANLNIYLYIGAIKAVVRFCRDEVLGRLVGAIQVAASSPGSIRSYKPRASTRDDDLTVFPGRPVQSFGYSGQFMAVAPGTSRPPGGLR